MADETNTPFIKKLRSRPSVTNPFAILFERICRVTPVRGVPKELEETALPNVRIALVSMPSKRKAEMELVPFSSVNEDSEPPPLDRDACKRTLVKFDKSFADKMLESFSEALHAALVDNHANIVCFNELGFPSLDMKPMTEAVQLAHKMSKEHNALIIAGSAHDARTLYNTAFLFHPGSDEHGHVFHKSISAISVEEFVSVPPERRVPLINIFGLRIASMICIDVADYASIASVVRCADHISVLLVPCYTPRFEDMARIAKVTSEAMPGLVALVNARLPDAPAGLHQIWRIGEKEEWAPAKLPSGGYVTYVDVDTNKLNEDRVKWQTSDDNDTSWLFGQRYKPVIYT
jgi:predicted amidohydrolase